jgi:hypothetical protein
VKGRIVGIVVLLVIVAAAAVWQFVLRGEVPDLGLPRKTVVVRGVIGSEKAGFLEDSQVLERLRRRHGLEVSYTKAGSIEMVRGGFDAGADFLWPSSQLALEFYRLERDNPALKSGIIFASPLVLYSWDIVADALAARGLAGQEGSRWAVTRFPELVALVAEGTPWADLGLPQLYGKAAIVSTDPNRSNSGTLFAGLCASVLAGEVVDERTVEAQLGVLRDLFGRLGYLEHSTGVLFEQYLRAGVGSYPLVVGYENQIVEFALANPEAWPRLADRLRVLYPEPTVWSAHPLIALTPAGERLLAALLDPEMQRLAWERHGFRTGVDGIANDPSKLPVTGVADAVTKVIPVPTPRVMERILEALASP